MLFYIMGDVDKIHTRRDIHPKVPCDTISCSFWDKELIRKQSILAKIRLLSQPFQNPEWIIKKIQPFLLNRLQK